MTYLQIEEAAREGTSVLFPIGVIEEHGPHLPLAVDVYGSYLQSREVKSELERKGIKSLIAPPFYWGINVATGSFGGSFSCREETMISVLFDAMSSLKKWGFDRVFFINHHMDGGHIKALNQAIQKARREIGMGIYLVIDQFFAKGLGLKADEPHLLIYQSLFPSGPPSPYLNIHAEGHETSFMWHYLPELVNEEVWRTLKPTNLNLDDLLVWVKGGTEASYTPRVFWRSHHGQSRKGERGNGILRQESCRSNRRLASRSLFPSECPMPGGRPRTMKMTSSSPLSQEAVS
jgi:creatinine amidohydrolase